MAKRAEKIRKIADKIAAAEPVAPIDNRLGENASALNDAPRDDTPPHEDIPEDAQRGFDEGGDGEINNDQGLPQDCPVIALGKRGRTYYYLNPLRELISLGDREHTQTTIPALFSPNDMLLETYWPRWSLVQIGTNVNDKGREVPIKEWKITGWNVANCFRNLMRACSRAGTWNSFDHVRGLGGWADELSEQLVFHCGDVLWHLGDDGNVVTETPGRRGRLIYVGDQAITRPYDDHVRGDDEGPGQELVKNYCTWNLARPLIDSMLLLGSDVCSMIAGAIDWRPMLFVTGDMAQGKSTLLKLRRALHGPGGIIKAADASEAYIAQKLGMSCLPVNLDEVEGDERHNDNVVRLARKAAAGDIRGRWSPDGISGTSALRSCFSFSAILSPLLSAQDRRRMAIIRLGNLPGGGVKGFEVPQLYWEHVGQKLKRRIAQRWTKWKETAALMRAMLVKAGHTSASLDQYTTLMTAAWLVRWDHDPSAKELDEYQAQFDAETFREIADTNSNSMSCLDELVQAQPETYRGAVRKSVARYVHDIVHWKLGDVPEDQWGGGDVFKKKTEEDITKSARDTLASMGLAVTIIRPSAKHAGGVFLAVPYVHRRIADVFEGSQWRGAAGTTGGWVEALSRLPGTLLGHTVKIDTRPTKCVCVPVSLVLNEQAEKKEEENV